MSIEVLNEYGKIDITNDVIAQVVGESAIDCYGILGMASKHHIREGLTEIQSKKNKVIRRIESLKLRTNWMCTRNWIERLKMGGTG